MQDTTELVVVPELEESKELALLNPESRLTLKQVFVPHFLEFKTLEKEAQEIAVNKPKAARDMRLKLRKVRIACDKARKQAGEDALLYKKSVDGIYKILESNLDPIEKRMGEIEHAEELAAKAIADKLKADRLAELTPLSQITGMSVEFYDLANMPEAQYVSLRDSIKSAADAKLLAIKQAEEAKIAVEAARVKREQELAAENARLAQEAEKLRKDNETKLAEERRLNAEKAAKEKAERDRLEAIAKQKQKEQDEIAQKERDRLALEAENARKEAKRLADQAEFLKKAEQERLAKQAEEAHKLATGPDKAKLLAFAAAIEKISIPTLSSKAGQAFNPKLVTQVGKMVEWLVGEANKLDILVK